MGYDFLNVLHLLDADTSGAARALVTQGEELRSMPVIPGLVLDIAKSDVNPESARVVEANPLEGATLTVPGTAISGTLNGFDRIINPDMFAMLSGVIRAGGVIVFRVDAPQVEDGAVSIFTAIATQSSIYSKSGATCAAVLARPVYSSLDINIQIWDAEPIIE